MTSQYIISPLTTYNEDELLHETKVGIDSTGLPLHFTAYGKTQDISRERAQNLVDLLNSI